MSQARHEANASPRGLAQTAVVANADRMDDLRSDLLTLWQLRRRELDDMLAPLVKVGALAATQIVANLSAVIAAADNERAAFEAFLAAHELVADEDPGGEDGLAAVEAMDGDELTEARQRSAGAADAARRQGHPSLAGAIVELPEDPTATIHQLTPRGGSRKKH